MPNLKAISLSVSAVVVLICLAMAFSNPSLAHYRQTILTSVAEQEASVAAVACRAGAVIRGVDAIADKYATWADQIEWAEGVEHSEGVGRSADTGAEQRPITAAHQLGSLGDLA